MTIFRAVFDYRAGYEKLMKLKLNKVIILPLQKTKYERTKF